MFKNTKLVKTYNFLIRFIIIISSYGYIIYQLYSNQNYRLALNLFIDNNSFLFCSFILSIIVILMIFNWSIEALKWRYLINKIEIISFWKAIIAVLAGLSISTFTPNRVGEFLGRVFILNKTNPWKAIFISILCSMSQLMVTLSLGTITLTSLIFISDIPELFAPEFLIIFIGVLLIFFNFFLLLIYFKVSFISKIVNKLLNPKWRKIKGYLRVFSIFSFSELLNVLIFSFTRYLIFSTQYIILLYLFGISLNIIHAYMLIIIIYFSLSAIPSFAIAELGIRGSVAVAVFQIYYTQILSIDFYNSFGVLAATSVLWLVNIAFPALLGNIFIARINFIKQQS